MIAIPNMEKPKRCELCPCSYYSEGALSDICQITNEPIDGTPTDCPLIEIDEPKVGRWIDTKMTCYGAKVYKCSVCDNEIDEMPTEMGEPIWNYCPLCGAKIGE